MTYSVGSPYQATGFGPPRRERSAHGARRIAALGAERAARGLRSVVTAAVMTVATPAWAEYAISPGDVLALTVTGITDLNTKAPVDADGKIVLPLIGLVPIAGLSLAEATAKIQAALPSKSLSHSLLDGRNIPVIISPANISLTIAEYRPVYVNGDVAKPGEVSYRPGMTVRQAVVLSGGFDVARFKLANPLMEISDLNGEASGLWVQYAKSEAAVAKLQAELHDKGQVDPTAIGATPLSKGFTDNMMAIVQDQLESRNVDDSKERSYLTSASQKEAQRVDILEQQEVKEAEALKNDSADLDRFEELFKKGAIALPSLSEARRTVLASSTRALQTTAALASVQREQGELNRRLERLSEDRRLQVLKALQDEIALAAITKTKLQAITTKLRLVGAVKSTIVRGFDSQTRIDITRSTNGQSYHVDGTADAALQPGDVVEVVLPVSDPMTP